MQPSARLGKLEAFELFLLRERSTVKKKKNRSLRKTNRSLSFAVSLNIVSLRIFPAFNIGNLLLEARNFVSRDC